MQYALLFHYKNAPESCVICTVQYIACLVWKTADDRHLICLCGSVCNVYVGMNMFAPRSDGVTGEWRRLHNEELNDLYCSPYIVRVIKSRRMRCSGHVARMGEERGCIGSWWGNLRERDQT